MLQELGISVLCWVGMVRLDIPNLMGKAFSLFLFCFFWRCSLSGWESSLLCLFCWVFNHEWGLNYIKLSNAFPASVFPPLDHEYGGLHWFLNTELTFYSWIDPTWSWSCTLYIWLDSNLLIFHWGFLRLCSWDMLVCRTVFIWFWYQGVLAS